MFSLPRLSPTTHRCAERLWAYPCGSRRQGLLLCQRQGLLLCQRILLVLPPASTGRGHQDGPCCGVAVSAHTQTQDADSCFSCWRDAGLWGKMPGGGRGVPGGGWGATVKYIGPPNSRGYWFRSLVPLAFFSPVPVWWTRCRVLMLRLKTDSLLVCAR